MTGPGFFPVVEGGCESGDEKPCSFSCQALSDELSKDFRRCADPGLQLSGPASTLCLPAAPAQLPRWTPRASGLHTVQGRADVRQFL